MKELIGRISDSATAAQAHFQIWFTLREVGKAHPLHFDDMHDSRYVDFFHASSAGHYKLAFIELGCLFDSYPKAASFRALKASLRENGQADIASFIENSLGKYSDLIPKILTIRSKLIAHKELGVTSESVHEENGITPNQIAELINASCEAINEVSLKVLKSRNSSIATVSDRFERATFSLLKVLRKGRS
jgi:hypothetical protein